MMQFSQPLFILFFAAVFFAYHALADNTRRKALLLAASFLFYALWDVRFVPLLALIIPATWAAALLVIRSRRPRLATGLGIAVLLLPLALFKYFTFVASAVVGCAGLLGLELSMPSAGWALPVGISFFTFQAVSYVVEARRDPDVRTGLLDLALFIAFFPKLVAGPLVGVRDFVSQLAEKRSITQADFTIGAALFVLGFLYKAVLADNISPFVDQVYAKPLAYDALARVGAALGFYAQIYYDFAGYSAMAIGLARLLGYRLCDNFNAPYAAVSASDFWRRWHISLSVWIRDYLYIPLGGNRHGRLRQYRNLMVAMLIAGLWHGASWNFVFWGGLHGLALVVCHAWRNKGPGLPLPLAWLLTQAFILLSWIPFRAANFSDTALFAGSFLGLGGTGAAVHIPWLLMLLPLVLGQIINPYRLIANAKNRAQNANRALLYGSAVMFALALLFVTLELKPFVYQAF